MLIDGSVRRKKFGINEIKLKAIESLLQEAICRWVENEKSEPFAINDLVSDENNSWVKTPLQILYKKYEKSSKNKEIAFRKARIDLGWILKNVLDEDKRIFNSKKSLRKYYRYLGK